VPAAADEPSAVGAHEVVGVLDAAQPHPVPLVGPASWSATSP
jgi:hypothetical protein